MRFLVDEDLPRSTNDVLRRYKHEAIDVRGIGLRGAKDHQIAAYAQSEGLCLLTGDFDFSDIRNYPPGVVFGIRSSQASGDGNRFLHPRSIGELSAAGRSRWPDAW
jgi:predicted nuclease of predicted toxin-antitoxin system